MSEQIKDDGFRARFLRRLTLGMTFAALCMLAFGGAYAHFSHSNMGLHGWVAMAVGTVISFTLAGVLTAVMVLGRRGGADEAAGEIDWE